MSFLKPYELLAKIRRKQMALVYYFAGEEEYLKSSAVEELLDVLLDAQQRDCNLHQFDAATASADDIVRAAATMPFLSEKRVVIVKNIEKISQTSAKTISSYIENLSQQTCLILLSRDRKADPKHPLVSAAAVRGEVVTFWRLFEQEGLRWIVSEFRQHQKQCPEQAAKRLWEITGDSLEDLKQEIEKIVLYLGIRPDVTGEDVELCGGTTRSSSVFELRDALQQKNQQAALAILKKVESEGEDATRLLNGVIYPWLRQMLKVKLGGAKAPETSARAWAQQREKEMIQAAQRFSSQKLLESLDHAVECDHAIKTGKMPGAVALELFVLGFCRS